MAVKTILYSQLHWLLVKMVKLFDLILQFKVKSLYYTKLINNDNDDLPNLKIAK